MDILFLCENMNSFCVCIFLTKCGHQILPPQNPSGAEALDPRITTRYTCCNINNLMDKVNYTFSNVVTYEEQMLHKSWENSRICAFFFDQLL